MQKAHDDSYNDYWKNKPNITTPIVQDQLNRIETTIDTIDDRVVTFDTTKANQTDLLADIKNVSFDSSTGTFTFTKQNNTTIIIDTDIEKIAINFDYDDDPESAHYQNLIITLDDGTVKYIDMSALITEYEFTDSSVIHFTITNGVISADVINGSITAEKLQPNFLADCVSAKEGAETAETNAETAETNALAHQYTAEAWAKGTKNNVPVTPSDAQYHDNAYYWAQQARAIVGDKVDSFNGRTGTVLPADGDYSSNLIAPATGAIPGQVPVVRNVGTGQDIKLEYVNEDLDIGLKPHIIVISETGSTVTLTKGTKVIYANETSPEHFEADVTEFGTWVIDSILSGDDAQVSLVVDAVKIYTVDDSHFHADITVTYPTGGTCSCSKSGTTTLYATGSPYTFTVHESGTYTITAIANGETYTDTVEVTTSGQTESLTIPEGSTVTPTDSVATLLSCAGIHDTSITSVSDLLADTTTLLAVINSNNAIDYLVRSTTWAGIELVPVMTSDTTPSGECFGSAVYNAYACYKAFNGILGSTNDGNRFITQVVPNGYLGYHLPTPRIVNKVRITQVYGSTETGTTNTGTTLYIEGSNDGTTYTTLLTKTCTVDEVRTTLELSFSNDTAYSYYRVRSSGGNLNSGMFEVRELQFYSENICDDQTAMSYIGLNNYAANTLLADADWCLAIANSAYLESVLNVKVPTMTSDTTPSGTVIHSTNYQNYYGWYPFNNASTITGITNGHFHYTTNPPQYVGYDFGTNIKVCKVEFKCGHAAGATTVTNTYKVQVSSDNSTWTDVPDSSRTITTTNSVASNITMSSMQTVYCCEGARYVRLYNTSTGAMGYIQFYCREDV